MKAETPLDYALFQLDSNHSRCELWISAGGVTEKLASGLLKPFLAHLRAAQEQISSGAQSIRLQAPSVTANGRNSGAAWFSKGTMERFVRFVSIPEVLERVSAVEAECQRLEEAINILATESVDGFHMFNSAVLVPGVKSLDGKGAARTGESKKPKQDYHETTETTGDASKRQLLRAMDGRRAMLQKEQKKALAQAVAAGFNMECMPDLVVFADCFGAIQLREACVKFMALRKKIQEYGSLIDEMELAAETVSTGLKMSRSGVILLGSEDSGEAMPACISLSGKRFDDQRDIGGCFDVMHEKSVISSSDNQKCEDFGASGNRVTRSSVYKTGSSGLSDSFKRQVGPPELHFSVKNHVRKLSVEKLDYSTNRSSECKQTAKNLENPSAKDSKKFNVADDLCPSSKMSTGLSPSELPETVIDTSIAPEKDLPSDKESNYSTDHDPRHLAGRSSSSFRKFHIGRPPVSRQDVVVIKNFSEIPSNSQEGDSTLIANDKGSKVIERDGEHESGVHSDEARPEMKSEHRRLSVQDAINLFESKRKELPEAQSHKVSGSDKLKEFSESGKPSAPVKDVLKSAPVKDVLKRWNGAGDPGPELATKPPFKAEGTGEDKEANVSAKIFKSSSHDDGDTGDKFQTTDLQKSRKLHSVRDRINDDASPAESDMEQQLSMQPKLNSRIAAQFDSVASRQQKLQNFKVSANVDSPDYEMHSSRRWSLATPPFHSTFNKDQVKLDGCSDSAKDSMLNHVQLLNQTVVKGVLFDKGLPSEQNKPKNCPPAKLGLNNNNSLHGKVSAMEEIDQADDPCDGSFKKTSPESHPDMVPVEMIPRELSWKATNIPNRQTQQGLKDTLKGIDYQLDDNPVAYSPEELLSEKSTGKGTVRRSWSIPSDFHLEALAKMVDSKDDEEDEHVVNGSGSDVKDLKGRLYEQYRQKRDAKLRQESGSKKAEREAKMKTMQEALERRKEELTAKNTRLVENNFAVLEDSERLQNAPALKAGILKSQRGKDARKQYSEDTKLQTQQRSIQSPPILQESESTGSTRMGKHADSRQNTLRKVSPVSQKPSSFTAGARPVGNPSTTMPKNSNPSGVHCSNQRGGSFGNQSKAAGNVLGRSLPSSAELRKESMKPFLGQSVHSLYLEKGNTFRGSLSKDYHQHADIHAPGNESAAFNSLEVALPDSLMQASESTRGSQKSLPSQDDTQQDETFLNLGFSAEDRQADQSSEAMNTLLQDNDELRSESEPGKTILQLPSVPNAVKVDSEGDFTDEVKVNYEEDLSPSSSNVMPLESEEPGNISTGELEGSFHHAKQSFDTKGSIRPLDNADEEVCIFYSGDQDVSTLPQISSTDPRREISNLGTSQTSQRFLARPDHQDSRLQVPNSSFVELGKPPLPTLYALHSKEMSKIYKADLYDTSLAQSFSSPKDLQLHDLPNAEDRNAFLGGSHSVSSFHASPISGDDPQAHCSLSPSASSTQSDQAQSRKTWINSQKSISLSSQQTQKESSKGFKRLLKFGRKSHGSEHSTQDWIAASTSEGDEDGDESKDYVGEDDLKALGSDSRNMYKTEKLFKLTDLDGVNGPGSRSFFSLSSFRSKTSDSRLRS